MGASRTLLWGAARRDGDLLGRRAWGSHAWVRIASDDRRNAPTWPTPQPTEALLDQYSWWLRNSDPRILTALDKMADEDREANRTLLTTPLAQGA